MEKAITWWLELDGTMKRFFAIKYYDDDKFWKLTVKQIKFIYQIAVVDYPT